MRTGREPPIQIKTPGQLAVMREAGLVVAHALRTLAAAVEPGISTADLDALAEREIRAAGAVPSFKGYYGFPPRSARPSMTRSCTASPARRCSWPPAT